MHVLEPPFPRAPHTCAVTHRADGPMVDMGVDTNGLDQRLYLRPSAIEEAGKLIGMVPKAEYDEAVARLEDKMVELRAVVKALKNIEHAEAGIEDANKDLAAHLEDKGFMNWISKEDGTYVHTNAG